MIKFLANRRDVLFPSPDLSEKAFEELSKNPLNRELPEVESLEICLSK